MAENEADLEQSIKLEGFKLALEAAVGCLRAVSLAEPASLSELRNVNSIFKRLEILTVALVRNGDHSWADIADEQQVKRQTVHYRLARRVVVEKDALRRALNLPGRLSAQRQECRRTLDRLHREFDQLGLTNMR